MCLTLSFDNWQLAHQYLPEIMYIVTVMAACGPAVIRSSTHAFLVNTVQSLISHFPLLLYDQQRLESILVELSDAKYTLLFGLSRSTPDTAFSASANSANDAVDALSISGLETIVTLLIEIMELSASTGRFQGRITNDRSIKRLAISMVESGYRRCLPNQSGTPTEIVGCSRVLGGF